jgi:hypothetical protein
VSDRDREIRALRVIAVSGRAALARAGAPEERERLRQRVHELLADLEQEVIRDGAEERILAAIEHERRRIWED